MAEYFLVHLLPTYISAVAGIVVGLYCLLRAKAPDNLLLGGWLLAHGMSFAFLAYIGVATTYAGFIAGVHVNYLLNALVSILSVWFIVRFVRAGLVAKVLAGIFTAFIVAISFWRLLDVETFLHVVPAGQGDPFFGTTPAVGFQAQPDWSMLFTFADLLAASFMVLLAMHYVRSSGARRRSMLFLVTLLSSSQIYFALDTLIFTARAWEDVNRLGTTFGVLGDVALILMVLGVSLGAMLWTMRSDGWQAKGRAWILAGIGSLALVTGMLLDNNSDILGFIWGLLGIIFPAGIAFAALRGQMPGLDGKARITIRSGTLAAIFLAVGFVVSEAAAEFFGQTSGNQYWGILAAGLLMFAIAPLQRLSTRIADATVPGPGIHAGDAATTFEQLVRMAWVDGKISHAERRELEAARMRLGLDESAAYRIQQRVLD